ncbi:MAG: P-loop NTPase [Thermodesulfovibrionales bacterium]
MSEKMILVKLEVHDPKALESIREAVSSMRGFRIVNAHMPPDPGRAFDCDLLIREIGRDIEAELREVRAVQDRAAAREIFLTSARTEPKVLLEALRMGIREFFPQPVNREEVRLSLVKFRERVESAGSEGKTKKGKIISVVGGKGGVGTTTVAVNLATGFPPVDGGVRVALMDLNLLFGEVPLFLDIRTPFNWGEMARDISRLDDAYLMSILSKHPSGIYVLPAPSQPDRMQAANPETIELLVRHLQATFDFVVMDAGHTLSDITLKALELSDTVFVVSVLTLPCLINVRKMLDLFQRIGYPAESALRVLANRHHKKPLIPLDEAEKSINRPIAWTVPNDYHTTMTAINSGRPIDTVVYRNGVAGSLRQLAATFLEGEEKGKEREKSTVFGSLFGLKPA